MRVLNLSSTEKPCCCSSTYCCYWTAGCWQGLSIAKYMPDSWLRAYYHGQSAEGRKQLTH